MIRTILSTDDNPHKVLEDRLRLWSTPGTGKTANKEIFWFPKPRTEFTDMRKNLQIAFAKQNENEKNGKGKYFEENLVAVDLAKLGSITRPSVGTDQTVSEYAQELTANKPHVSSFRMLNRLFRFLGLTTRELSSSNRYVLTELGEQLVKFDGPFPANIGNLSENEWMVERLVNVNVFSVHDTPSKWDTRFRTRIIVNLLRCTAEFGYITINEAVVTALALKDERSSDQIHKMIERLRNLHKGTIDIVDAFKECRVDPNNSSATSNAYDTPKMLTSLCRQTGLFEKKTVGLKDSPFGDLRPKYKRMYKRKSRIKKSDVVNILTKYGLEVLKKETDVLR